MACKVIDLITTLQGGSSPEMVSASLPDKPIGRQTTKIPLGKSELPFQVRRACILDASAVLLTCTDAPQATTLGLTILSAWRTPSQDASACLAAVIWVLVFRVWRCRSALKGALPFFPVIICFLLLVGLC